MLVRMVSLFSLDRCHASADRVTVEGKRVEPMFYFGGVAPYFAQCKKEIDEGFPGFKFSTPEGVKA